MHKAEFQKPFEANYIVVKLDVSESPDKKDLENPGGNELMKTLGGEKSGLPFYAFLDEKGKKLADANVMPKNGNIGYPAEPQEIDAFVGLLKKTAPRLKEAQLQKIKAFLQENAPRTNANH